MVFADELSVVALVDGIRAGRTVVRRDPDSPMVELTSNVPAEGDTITGTYRATLHATVTKGLGHTVHFVHDGEPLGDVDVKADPFDVEVPITAPAHGEERWRVEVSDGRVRTVTSHIWIGPAMPDGRASETAATLSGGCGCSLPGAPPRSSAAAALLALRAIVRRRRRGVGKASIT